VRPGPTQPGVTARVHGELHASPPTQPVALPRSGFDDHLAVQAGESAQLFGDDGRLEGPLRRKVDVLPVATAAASGPRVRASARDTVGRGSRDLHGVGPQETVALATFGHDRADTLPRQAMPHEDHAPVVPGDAEATMCNRADIQLQLGADETGTALERATRAGGIPGSAAPAGGRGGHGAMLPARLVIGRSCQSSSSWPSDERSCQGTLATMTPGMKLSRTRRRRAD